MSFPTKKFALDFGAFEFDTATELKSLIFNRVNLLTEEMENYFHHGLEKTDDYEELYNALMVAFWLLDGQKDRALEFMECHVKRNGTGTE